MPFRKLTATIKKRLRELTTENEGHMSFVPTTTLADSSTGLVLHIIAY